MRKTVRFASLSILLLGAGLAHQAQAQCTNTTTFLFSDRNANEDWKSHAAVAVPVAISPTTIATSGYASGATGTAAVLRTQDLNGNTQTLYWGNTYASTTVASDRVSTVTFNFNRAVANLIIQVQDIDASTGFTDEVTFAGSNGGTSAAVALTKPGGSTVSIAGATATGTTNVTNNPGGTVTATFTGSITTLTLTYRNVTGATPAQQAVGIDQMSWCRIAPIANNVTNAATLSSAANQTAIDALSASSEGSISSYTVTQIPLSTAGVLYYDSPILFISNYVAVAAGQVLTPAQAASLRFDPAITFPGGNVVFSYTAKDNLNVVSNVATFTIPISINNHAPVVRNDSRDVRMNTAASGNVVLNDSDEDGDNFTAALVTGPTHGTLSFNANGTYTYTPTTNYVGSDSFTYRACDTAPASLCSTPATVSLRVFNTNSACISSVGTNLLANPNFSAGNTGFTTNYRYVGTAFVANDNASGIYPEGTYAVGANANTYHPGFQGTGRTGTNDPFLMVNGASSIRTLYAQTVAVQPNSYYTFSAYFNNLLPPGSNQGVPVLGFVINGESVSGTITLNESPDTWQPFSDVWFSGNNTTATFEIRNVSTAIGGNDLGVDDVFFGSCNLAPTAVADAATIATGATASISVLANDVDPENSFNAATVDLDPNQAGIQASITKTEGIFTVNASGMVAFEPATGFIGTAVTPYTVQDASSVTTNQANIVVTVQQVTANLVVTLTAPAASTTVVAGQPITFTLQTNNSGPAAASNVAPTLQLPAGLTSPGTGGAMTFSNGGTYNNATGLVTFPVTNSQANGVTNTYSVTFQAPGSGPFAGTGSATSATPDLTTDNNGATVTVGVTPAFDLTTALSGPVAAGTNTPLVYAVVTKNNGPSLAAAVAQTVELPGNLTGLFLSNKGTYAYSSGTNTTVVTFPVIDFLPAGQTVSNTISVKAPATATAFTATAKVAASGETATGNNSATATTTVSATATATSNVYTTVTATSGGVAANHAAPGTSLLLTGVTSNAGPDAAPGVVSSLALAAGLDPASLTISAGGTYDAASGVVTWPATSLTSGTSQTYTVQLPAPAYGPLRAMASVSTTTADPVAGDNGATAIVAIDPAADVVTTILGPSTVTAGQRVTYTMTTTNTGGIAAANVLQFVRVPPAVANLTYTNNQLPGTTGAMDVQPNQTLLAYPAIPSLAPGQTLTNTVTFDVPASAQFPVMSFVTTTTADNQTATNTSTVLVTPARATNVTTTISGPTDVVNGTPVVLSVRSVNNGPGAASDVATRMHLPTGLTGVVVRDVTGAVVPDAYNATTGVLTWPLQADLAVGAAGSVTNTVTFNAPDVMSISATAVTSVSAVTNDLNLSDNSASFAINVLRSTATTGDLSTTISSNVGTQAAGQPVTFTLTTVNNGTVAAMGVVQRVALPAGLPLASVSASGSGVYDPATGIVTFPTVGSQAAGAAGTQTNTIVVTAPGVGPLTAVASAHSGTSEATAANNTAVTSVDITPVVNVRTIVRAGSALPTSSSATVLPGQPITYLVRGINDGPSPAQDVAVTAQLPIGLNPATVLISGGGSYNAGTGVVTFPVVGTLLATQQATAASAYTITFPVPTGSVSYNITGTTTTSSTQTSTIDDSQAYATNLANQTAMAHAVVNSLTAPDGNTSAVALPISALSGSDGDGSVSSFAITSLPNAATEGTLYYSPDGSTYSPVALSSGRFSLPAATAGNLRFDPVSTFVGNAFFTYTATDNSSVESAPVLYAIPVGQDNATVFTAAPVRGGVAPYQNGDLITSAFDANGGEYLLANVTDTGVRTAATDAAGTSQLNTLGLTMDPGTGRITVANRLLLRSGSYSIPVTTIDEFGGTTTQPVAFTIGSAPLPVELKEFDVKAVKVNAQLAWSTASEKNNDHFNVERSLTGSDFVKIGQVQGHGTSTTANSYAFLDANIGTKATGPVYYRLQQVDADGTSSYSPVRTVRFENGITPSLSVYPNPASAQSPVATLDLSTLPQGAYQATLLDMTGRQVAIYSVEGGVKKDLNVRALQAGSYIIQVRGNGLNLTRRLTKE